MELPFADPLLSRLRAGSILPIASSSYELFGTSKENLELAERIERKNQIKFFEGLSGSFDLRQAQLQLYSAQSTYLNSMKNLINKKYELELIINESL